MVALLLAMTAIITLVAVAQVLLQNLVPLRHQDLQVRLGLGQPVETRLWGRWRWLLGLTRALLN